MADAAPKPPLTYTIASAKLDRIENDLRRLRRNPVDGPMLSRFEYDHSNTLVIDSRGKRDLLILNSVPLASDIARLLQHTSPAIVGELVRGYRLAKAVGLLGDDQCSETAALFMSRKDPEDYIPSERIADGKEQMAALAEVLRKENRKPGGIKTS
jgi:hypothetical protein